MLQPRGNPSATPPRDSHASGSTRPLVRGGLAALPDPGALPAQGAEVVQLGPAHLAPGHDLDLVDGRAVHRERPLHAHAVADLANCEGLPGTATLAPDHHTLENLDPGPASLNHPDVDLQRVPGPERGDVLADLGPLQVGDGGVHGWRSSMVLAHMPTSRWRCVVTFSGCALSAESIPAQQTSAGRRISVCHIF